MPNVLTIFEEIKTQIVDRPHIPLSANFSNKTIIITGANTGKEAAWHFVQRNATKVIIAARSIENGTAAAQEIEQDTGRENILEAWELDYGNYESV